MATPSVLTFDAEGRAVDFEVWLDDLQLFLQCDRADGLSLFYLTSGVSPAPPSTADSTVRSQRATRDAAARLAVRRHLPTTERAHFSQYRSAQTLYDAVVARYSSPATAALSRLFLPYLFPDLAAFPTVTDLITHLRTSDTRYRAALPAEFCAKNFSSLYLTLYYVVTPSPLTRVLPAPSFETAPHLRRSVGRLQSPWRTPLRVLSLLVSPLSYRAQQPPLALCQDQGVDQFTPASQQVTHCTCARTGRHLATFTRRPGSSLYTLSTESPPVSASGQVAASSQVLAAASGSGP
ncbi:unnamed protein product, partial [Closterium sp. NIES-54]